MADLYLKKLFFDDVRKNNWPETGIVFIVFFDPLSQSIGRGRISREGALDARESRERRDKIAPKSSPVKQEINAIEFEFWPDFFHIFEQDRSLFARVDIGVTDFPTKTAEKEEEKNGSEICFQKWRAHPVFSGGELFHFFGRGKLTFF